jgi:hypothetical protein
LPEKTGLGNVCLTRSTVKVTEQSRMDVLRQCGSCIMALVQK